MPIATISNEEESAENKWMMRKYPLGMGLSSLGDEIFLVQKNIIEDLAAKESCIIVGRCADSILQNYKNHLGVYIYAPIERRLENCVDVLHMEVKLARKMIKEVDMARDIYYRKYCPEVTSIFEHKDIMLDSSKFGVDGCAKILAQIVKEKWEKE